MAKAIPYTPTPVDTDTAQDALDTLVTILHERGVLRLITNFVDKNHDITAIALTELTKPGGKQLTDNLMLALSSLASTDTKELESVLAAFSQGLGAAQESLQQEPPSVFGLLAKLNEPDVRRGLFAALTLLEGLGAGLKKP